MHKGKLNTCFAIGLLLLLLLKTSYALYVRSDAWSFGQSLHSQTETPGSEALSASLYALLPHGILPQSEPTHQFTHVNWLPGEIFAGLQSAALSLEHRSDEYLRFARYIKPSPEPTTLIFPFHTHT